MDQLESNKALEPPRGIFPARVDEKGRLKLPVVFQSYLKHAGTKVFVTSLDARTARIYPLPVWAANEALFEEVGAEAQDAEDLAFVANDFGAESELDTQGRVLIHPELRRMLGIENQPVYLSCYRGRIDVYSQVVYEERKQRALERLDEKRQVMERRGLK